METMILLFLFLIFAMNRNLAIENLALRQQLAIMKRNAKRPKLQTRDRIFWVIVSNLWKDWKNALIIVQPDTVVQWHRKGFKLFWKIKSRNGRVGRPSINPDIRRLIEEMANANPLWGAPRIHGELMRLGIELHERTVSKIIRRLRTGKPPSQTWRAFLKNHMHNTFAIDFFTVPTATFRVLYVFVILQHESRKVVHFNVAGNPTAKWTAQQIVEACPWDTSPKFLLRDRDGIYGDRFQKRVENMGIKEIKTAPRSPWQNPYLERLIGSIRRDCLDHMIVLNTEHLRSILSAYLDYYHNDRTHLSLGKDTPFGRSIQRKPESGKLIALPRLGGLHHRYEWQKAA
jgi:putative transposase